MKYIIHSTLMSAYDFRTITDHSFEIEMESDCYAWGRFRTIVDKFNTTADLIERLTGRIAELERDCGRMWIMLSKITDYRTDHDHPGARHLLDELAPKYGPKGDADA